MWIAQFLQASAAKAPPVMETGEPGQNFEQFFALGSFGLHFCLFIQASRLVLPRLSNFRVVARVPSRFVPRLLASNACLRTSPTVFYSQAVIHELCHVQQHG
jgi:hypothetical protein